MLLKKLDSKDFDNLYKTELIDSIGIPNFWGSALVFSSHLKRFRNTLNLNELGTNYDPDPKKLNAPEFFIYYLAGLFSGILYLDTIETKNLGLIRHILKDDLRLRNQEENKEFIDTIDNFLICIRYNNESGIKDEGKDYIVAVYHPECLFFPSDQFSVWPNQEGAWGNDLEQEMLNSIENWFKKDTTKKQEVFKTWLYNINRLVKPQLLGEFINIYLGGFDPTTEQKNRFTRFTHIISDSHNRAIIGFDVVLYTEVQIPEGIKSIQYDYSKHKITGVDGKGLKIIDIEQKLGLVRHEDKNYVWRTTKTPNNLMGLWDVLFETNQITFISRYSGVVNDWYITVDEYIKVDKSETGKYVFIDNSVTFDDDIEESHHPDIPLKIEYLFLYESCHFIKKDEHDLEFSIDLKGLGNVRVKIRYDDLAASFLPHLMIYPNFILEDWNLYYMFYDSKDTKFSFSYIYEENDFFTKELILPEQVNKFSSPPAYLSLQKQGSEFGLFFVSNKLDSLNKEKNPDKITLGLDFGTSNSCASILIGEEDSIVSYNDLSYCYFTAQAIRGTNTRNFVPLISYNNTIPSELYKHPKTPINDWRNGYTEAVIPAPQPEERGEISKIQQGLIRNIKWNNNYDEIKLYLYNFLFLVFSNIINNNFTHRENSVPILDVSIVASYPLTFSEEQIDSYKKAIQSVMDYLATEIPVRLQERNPINTISESSSGVLKIGNKGDALVVDIGGGTTDFAYINSDKEILYADSLRLAGNHFVNAIYTSRILESDLEEYELENRIRSGSAINELIKTDNDSTSTFNKITVGFKKIILDILDKVHARLYNYEPENYLENAANISIKDIDIVLLGNGWKLFGSNFNLVNILKDKFDRISISNPVKEDDPKLFLAKNLLSYRPEKVGNKHTGKKGICGVDCQVEYFGTKNTRDLKWNEIIPYSFTEESKKIKLINLFKVFLESDESFYKKFITDDEFRDKSNNKISWSLINQALTDVIVNYFTPFSGKVGSEEISCSPLFVFIERFISGEHGGGVNRLNNYESQ